MSAAAAAANVAVGLTYMQVGAMGAVEMARNRRSMGFSQFGAAWIAVAFTCGPPPWCTGSMSPKAAPLDCWSS